MLNVEVERTSLTRRTFWVCGSYVNRFYSSLMDMPGQPICAVRDHPDVCSAFIGSGSYLTVVLRDPKWTEAMEEYIVSLICAQLGWAENGVVPGVNRK